MAGKPSASIYRHMTQEERKNYSRAYYHRNIEKWREYHRKYHEKRNPQKLRIARRKDKMKSRYGITIEEYVCMNQLQNGLCAICGNPPSQNRNLDVDHNHSTQKVRKLLYRNCNMGIGYFHENISMMEKAIQYLKNHI